MQRAEVRTEYTRSHAANPSASLGPAANVLFSQLSTAPRVDSTLQVIETRSSKRNNRTSKRRLFSILPSSRDLSEDRKRLPVSFRTWRGNFLLKYHPWLQK